MKNAFAWKHREHTKNEYGSMKDGIDYLDMPGQANWFRPKQAFMWGLKWELACAVLTKDWNRVKKVICALNEVVQ